MNESRIDIGAAHVAEFWTEVARAAVTGDHEDDLILSFAALVFPGAP